MKQIKDLTSLELLELNSQDKADVIDLECALRGIKLLPPKPVASVNKVPEKDVTVYKVGDFKFLCVEDATEVLDCILSQTSLTGINSSDYSNYYVSPLESYYQPKVESEKVYSKEKYETIKLELEKYKLDNNSYRIIKKEYDECCTNIQEIKNELNELIQETVDYNDNVEKYTYMFERYLVLANGDKEVASNFLLNSNPDSENYPEINALWTV